MSKICEPRVHAALYETYRSPWLRGLLLFLVGVLILVLRNPDPLINQVVYTEDGAWIGLALTKGWSFAAVNAKPGYFVWGNLCLLWAAVNTSRLIYSNALTGLPQAIACYSYAFFAGVATLAFYTTRNALPFMARMMLFSLLLLQPFGDSSNEILGRLSNIGYTFVPITVFILYARGKSSPITFKKLIGDTILFLCVMTNPVCLVIAVLYLIWMEFHFSIANIRIKFINNAYFIVGLLVLGGALAMRWIVCPALNCVDKPFQMDHLVELIFARCLSFPFTFWMYRHLSDLLSVIFFLVWAGFILWAYLKSENKTSRFLTKLSGISLFIFLLFTMSMRSGLTAFMEGYETSFPDRYFVGLNSLVIMITVIAVGQMVENRQRMMRVTGMVFGGLIMLVYLLNIPYLFETRHPRKLIRTDLSFTEQIYSVRNSLSSVTRIPIYFKGWSMDVPRAEIDKALIVVRKDEFINSATHPSIKASSLSDGNWEKGVNRRVRSILLFENIESNRRLMRRPLAVTSNGLRARVLSVEQDSQWIRVTINREGKAFAYPNSIEVIM